MNRNTTIQIDAPRFLSPHQLRLVAKYKAMWHKELKAIRRKMEGKGQSA